MDSLGGRNLCGIQLHGKTGVAVGQGGLLLTTDAAGSSWSFADAGLPKNVPCDWDFHAVHGAGKQYWVVGRPGSVVLHSGDDGAHWEVQRTGQPLPLNGVFFADEQHGWAVGELGSILATADGGKSWKVQRRGGQRTAALFVHARAAGTPLDTVALLGGQDGYVTGSVRVTAADPASAALIHCTDEARLSAAVRQAGGAASETLWQFPVASHLAHANRDDLLRAWDQLHGDRAAEQMLRQLVLALRMWRPDVIVTDGPDARRRTAWSSRRCTRLSRTRPIRNVFPEQLSVMGLEPWKASKLYGRCDGRADGQVSIDLTAVSGPLESTLREFASAAAAGLGDEAVSLPTERIYRLLAAVAPAAADHRDLMQGVELAPGGLARRPLAATRDLARHWPRRSIGGPPCWRWRRRRSTAWPTRTSWSAASSRCCTTCPTSRPADRLRRRQPLRPHGPVGAGARDVPDDGRPLPGPSAYAGRPPLADPAHLQQRGPAAERAGPVRGGRSRSASASPRSAPAPMPPADGKGDADKDKPNGKRS